MSLDEMMPWGEMSESVYLLDAYIKNDISGRHAAASLAMHTESGHICLERQLIVLFFFFFPVEST